MKSCAVLGVSKRLLDLPKINITVNLVNETVIEQKANRCRVIVTVTLPRISMIVTQELGQLVFCAQPHNNGVVLLQLSWMMEHMGDLRAPSLIFYLLGKMLR